MNIYRSSNTPIVIIFEENVESIQEIQISLYSDNNYSTLIQQWNKEDLQLSDKEIIIPLTQKETILYPVGIGHLEIKWLDENEIIHFKQSISVWIKDVKNLNILGEDKLINYSNSIIDLSDINATNNITIIKLDEESASISNEEIDSWFEEEYDM